MTYKYGKPLDVQITFKATDDMEVGIAAEAVRTGKSECELLQEFMLNLYRSNVDASRLIEEHQKKQVNKVNKVYE